MGTKLAFTELICALWSQQDARQVEGHTPHTFTKDRLHRLESELFSAVLAVLSLILRFPLSNPIKC